MGTGVGVGLAEGDALAEGVGDGEADGGDVDVVNAGVGVADETAMPEGVALGGGVAVPALIRPPANVPAAIPPATAARKTAIASGRRLTRHDLWM